jgi:nucleotidyltransferase/DNA polymerase involved in DNA repair
MVMACGFERQAHLEMIDREAVAQHARGRQDADLVVAGIVMVPSYRLPRPGGLCWRHGGQRSARSSMSTWTPSTRRSSSATTRAARQAVAVGGRQRGVVMAAIYEARKFGVRSAMPRHRQAALPELVFVKPRFDVYKEVSRQIRAIFLEYTPLVEPLSLDEAYLDVTTNLKNMPLGADIAREIRARILERTGLTASAGISYNKFLAKLASDSSQAQRPDVIPPEKGPAFVEACRWPSSTASAQDRREDERLGIHTGADLRRSRWSS